MKKDIIIDGKVFKTQQDVCDYYDIPLKTLQNRLYIQKLPIDIAVKQGTPHTKIIPQRIVVLGKSFKSKKAACEYFNIPYTTVVVRIKSGIPSELAVLLKVGRNVIPKDTSIYIRYENKVFRDFLDFCTYFKLDKLKTGKIMYNENLSYDVKCYLLTKYRSYFTK